MEKTHISCLGFIMDGNRRWADAQGLPTYEGHRNGGDVLVESIRWVRNQGIPHAVYYAFSTENWQRNEQEVSYLMDLFREWLQKFEEKLLAGDEEPVRIKIIGRKSDFADSLQEQMNRVEQVGSQKKEARTTIWLALSYGGRAEIIEAVNEAIQQGQPVTEESFERLLWTASMPDPDIIVRTSGEQRLSNFVTWKSVYSELYFIDKHWPALTKDDFDDILVEYEKRERRRGA